MRVFKLLTVLAAGSALLVPIARATAPGPSGLIAFRADVGNGDQIYTIRADGTGQRLLTSLPGNAEQPHWSPESNRIVFEFDPADPTATDFCNVAYMNRNGGGLTILPLGNGDQCEGSPTFSADGKRIYYEGFDGVSRDAIYSMNLNGTDREFVSNCQGSGATDPEVSPDGTMISFVPQVSRSGGRPAGVPLRRMRRALRVSSERTLAHA